MHLWEISCLSFVSSEVDTLRSPNCVMASSSKRARGTWCHLLVGPGPDGYLILQCKCCAQRLVGWKSIIGAGKAHWPGRGEGRQCLGVQPAPVPAPDNWGPLITHTQNAPHERGRPNYVDGEGVADQASPGRDPLPCNQQDAVPCHFPVGQCLTEPNFVGQLLPLSNSSMR